MMAAANLDICIVNWCMCLHVSQVNCDLSILNYLNDKDFT